MLAFKGSARNFRCIE